MRNIMLMVHFIGLAMGVGTGLANMFLGMAASRMEKPEALKFALKTLVLGKMGLIGIILLVISGGYLMTPFWKVLENMPTLIAKLALVLVLIIFLVIIKYNAGKAQKGDPEKYLKRLRALGSVTILLGLAIIALAVFSFH
jgi:uncharacterized membrane protein